MLVPFLLAQSVRVWMSPVHPKPLEAAAVAAATLLGDSGRVGLVLPGPGTAAVATIGWQQISDAVLIGCSTARVHLPDYVLFASSFPGLV